MTIGAAKIGASSATNGSAPTPGLPSGLAAGDGMVCVFFSREATDGTVSISAGWDEIVNNRDSGGLIAAWKRVWQSGDVAPTLTLGGHATGSSGDSAIAQIAAWPGVDVASLVGVVGSVSTNASAQNVGAISGITLGPKDAVIVLGGKRDDWTSVALLSGDSLTWSEVGEPDTTSGADAGLVWDYAIDGGSGTTVTSKTFTVTGGAAATGKGVMFSLNADLSQTVSGAGGIGSAEAHGSARLDFTLLNAGAVGSAEEFGAATVSAGGAEQSIAEAGAIASGESHGTSRLDFTLLGAGSIGSSEAHGVVRLDFTLVNAGGIATGEALGAGQVGFTLLGAGGVSSAEGFGGARLDFTITAAGAISSGEALGADRVDHAVTSAGGIPSDEGYGTPRFDFGIANAGAIASHEAFGASAVVQPGAEQTISGAGGIAGGEAFGVAAAGSYAPAQVVLDGFAPRSLAKPIVRLLRKRGRSALVIGIGGIARATVFGTAAVARGPAPQRIAAAGGIASAEAIGSFRVDLTIAAAGGIASAEAFGTELMARRARLQAERRADEMGLFGIRF